MKILVIGSGGREHALEVLRVHSLLFIEDDDAIRLALSLALEDEGYEVREAEDGRSGLLPSRRESLTWCYSICGYPI